MGALQMQIGLGGHRVVTHMRIDLMYGIRPIVPVVTVAATSEPMPIVPPPAPAFIPPTWRPKTREDILDDIESQLQDFAERLSEFRANKRWNEIVISLTRAAERNIPLKSGVRPGIKSRGPRLL